MASGYPLPPPPSLDIHGTQAANNWKKFKRAWANFSLAIELNKKPEPVQVATLLTVIGEEAREVFATFSDWDEEGDDVKIVPVLGKFAAYCEPRKSVPFERCKRTLVLLCFTPGNISLVYTRSVTTWPIS